MEIWAIPAKYVGLILEAIHKTDPFNSLLTLNTYSKWELKMSQKDPLGVEKVITLMPFIYKSNPFSQPSCNM